MIRSIVRGGGADARGAEAEYLLAPDVVLLFVEDGTARLLDLGGEFYAIPATGASMLSRTLSTGSSYSAARGIAAEYDVDLEQVRADIDAFLGDLERRGLICHPERRSRPYRRKIAVLSSVLPPVLRRLRVRPASLRARTWALLTLAYVSIRLFGWPETVRTWQRRDRKPADSPDAPEMKTVALAIDEAVRAVAAGHPLNIACKERALCCWSLMRSAGFPARLVLGVDLFPLASHCWCEAGRLVLSDDIDRCQYFTPVLSYE